MLTTSHLEDYILHKSDDGNQISIGGNHGQRRLKEHLLKQKNVDFDLNDGYNLLTEEKEHDRHLSVFLDWMMQKSPEGDLAKVLNGATFVSRRGILTRMAIGKALGDKGNWQIVCEKKKGVIFMQEEELPSEMKRKANASPLEKKATYWGHRFEEYMVEKPKSTLDPNENLLESMNNLSIKNTSNDIRMVMSAVLKNNGASVKLLYSGEVDAIDSEGRHVEMKTMKMRRDGFGYWFYKEKSLKWFLQSRFVDVDYLVVGLRDDNGHVNKLLKMKLDELKNREWNDKVCLNFLLLALKSIDRNVSEGEAFRVSCSNGSLQFTKITSKEAGILPQAFIDHFRL